ncbi:MAG: hypothetical protein ABMA64_34510 [Myxococcota bacterium]
MFDRIVERTDAEARRRSAASLVMTSALCATVGFAVGWAAWWVAPAATDTLAEVPIAFLVEPEGGGTPDLPAAPEPRPQSQASEPDPDAQPPEAALAVITPEPTGPTGASGTPDPGTGGGTGGGTTNQVGTSDGEPCTVDCGEVQLRTHTTLEVKRRVQPRYPESARALDLGEQRCAATVRVDAEGVPFEVVVEDCPAVFHAQTRESLLAWRFWPARDGRVRIPAQTRISVVYRLQD